MAVLGHDAYAPVLNFTADLLATPPRDPLVIIEKLAGYVLPKLQSTSVDITAESPHTIEDRLAGLIAKKV